LVNLRALCRFVIPSGARDLANGLQYPNLEQLSASELAYARYLSVRLSVAQVCVILACKARSLACARDDGEKSRGVISNPPPARSVRARARHCRIVILNEVKDPAYVLRITQTLLSDHETMGEVPRFAPDDGKKVARRYFELTSRAIGSSTRQTFSTRILCPAAFG
jgi:hypothetical protein